MTVPANIEWIAVDWGTSALRAWGLDAGGSVIANAASEDGMSKLAPEAFEPALLRLIAFWLPASMKRPVPVIACGMVGARQGWKEAAYREVPCSPLGTPFTVPEIRDARVHVQIVPGLSQCAPADVMRGEETQIAGLLHERPDFNGVACLPGTHTKWALISGGRIETFQTFMTGELYALLGTQSVLRHSMRGDGWSGEAFSRGLQDALENPASLAGELFALRAGSLLSGLKPDAARARLSGLLIGVELAATRAFWDRKNISVVGAGRMANAYFRALAAQGADPVLKDTTKNTLAGLHAAYRIYQGMPKS